MDFDVAITQNKDHTRVAITGAPSIEELLSLIHVMGIESGNWNAELVLVDLRRITTVFSEAEQFSIGREAACSLAHVQRIASLVPEHRLTRISEKAARRNGVDVRVFIDEKAALQWLRSKPEPDQPLAAKAPRKSALRRLLG